MIGHHLTPSSMQAEQLQGTVAVLAQANCNSVGFPVSATDSSLLYRGALGNAGAPAAGSLINYAGDRVATTPPPNKPDATPNVNRPLAPTVSEDLCFRFLLPSNAKSAAQGAATTLELRFIAVQSAGIG